MESPFETDSSTGFYISVRHFDSCHDEEEASGPSESAFPPTTNRDRAYGRPPRVSFHRRTCVLSGALKLFAGKLPNESFELKFEQVSEGVRRFNTRFLAQRVNVYGLVGQGFIEVFLLA